MSHEEEKAAGLWLLDLMLVYYSEMSIYSYELLVTSREKEGFLASGR